MPTTFSNIVPVRRVAVGDCSGPLGSGFDALARSAYSALLRADWTQSAAPPFLPVHDNGQTANKTIPRGDAWKCSYGYDATARTERSACGAVCYTFALPSDAHSGTPANISTVSLSLTGDRYLDAGVDLYLVPSASPTPPSISDLLALTPVGTYCATSDQSPTKPNERHGVTEAVEATLGVAAQPFLHVALLLHDYTTNRGAWIEGGAMLEGAAASIVFSRNVTTPSPATRSVSVLQMQGDPTPTPVAIIHRWNYAALPATMSAALTLPPIVASGAAALAAIQLGTLDNPDGDRSRGGMTVYNPHIITAESTVMCGLELRSNPDAAVAYGLMPAYDAAQLPVGSHIALPADSASTLSLLRVVAVEASTVADIPDLADGTLWAGSSPDCVGVVDFSGASGGTLIVSRPPASPFVRLVYLPISSSASSTSVWRGSMTLSVSH